MPIGQQWKMVASRALLFLMLLLVPLAGCAFHSGSDALAFLRDGQLWTVQADGANLHQVASGGIVSFSWSPDHRQFVYRTASPFPDNRRQTPIENAPDLSGNLSVVSVNGGSAIPITPDASALARSDAWWNPNGNRLLYAERFPTSGGLDDAAEYVVAQADQPVGIASKAVPDAASLPAVSADGAQVATINAQNELLVGAAGAPGKMVTSGVLRQLPNTSRPGRVLWRPRSSDLLYAMVANGAVQLTLREASGATRALGSVPTLFDAAFSPDGAWLLVRTPETFVLWDVKTPGSARYQWENLDQTAIPYWAPDSRRILVFDAAGASLVDPTAQTQRAAIKYNKPHVTAPGSPPHWRPAPGGPWSPDGGSVTFVAAVGDSWNGEKLSTAGLYVVAINGGVQVGSARLIDNGADEAPFWGYLDASASFLLPS